MGHVKRQEQEWMAQRTLFAARWTDSVQRSNQNRPKTLGCFQRRQRPEKPLCLGLAEGEELGSNILHANRRNPSQPREVNRASARSSLEQTLLGLDDIFGHRHWGASPAPKQT
jgi:hypothetical protein